MYNCPNCAAPIGYSPVCEYCGTRLDWMPIQRVEIRTVPARVQRHAAEVIWNNEDLRLWQANQVEEYTMRVISEKMSDKLVKSGAIRIVKEEHPVINKTVFRGDLTVVV